MDHEILKTLTEPDSIEKQLKEIRDLVRCSQRTSNPMKIQEVHSEWKTVYVDGIGYLVPCLHVKFK